MRAITAATRFTTDSAASESSPTDPVSRYAPVFSAMVTTAAAIESRAYRSRPEAGGSDSAPTCGNAISFIELLRRSSTPAECAAAGHRGTADERGEGGRTTGVQVRSRPAEWSSRRGRQPADGG